MASDTETSMFTFFKCMSSWSVSDDYFFDHCIINTSGCSGDQAVIEWWYKKKATTVDTLYKHIENMFPTVEL